MVEEGLEARLKEYYAKVARRSRTAQDQSLSGDPDLMASLKKYYHHYAKSKSKSPSKAARQRKRPLTF